MILSDWRTKTIRDYVELSFIGFSRSEVGGFGSTDDIRMFKDISDFGSVLFRASFVNRHPFFIHIQSHIIFRLLGSLDAQLVDRRTNARHASTYSIYVDIVSLSKSMVKLIFSLSERYT